MAGERKASFGFTKLIVDDEEAMAEYYHQVYGLNKLQRVSSNGSGGAMGAFREVIMGPGETMSSGPLPPSMATLAEPLVIGMSSVFSTDPEGRLSENVELLSSKN